jgi:thioredoxin 1
VTTTDASLVPPLLVACLCAQWCGTCGSYRSVFDQSLAEFKPGQLQAVWVDVEDHDETVGALDIENFPTLLIARGDEVLFFGTALPHAATLVRMVRSALEGSLQAPPPLAEVQGLPARIRAMAPLG